MFMVEMIFLWRWLTLAYLLTRWKVPTRTDVFVNMVSLASLDLSFDQFKVAYQNRLKACASWKHWLILWENKFSDRLEDSVEILSCAQETFQVLNLAANSFWGSLPDDDPRFSSLRFLQLFSNNMSGSVPQSFQLLSHLTDFRLDYNQFSGSFPYVTGLSSLAWCHGYLFPKTKWTDLYLRVSGNWLAL